MQGRAQQYFIGLCDKNTNVASLPGRTTWSKHGRAKSTYSRPLPTFLSITSGTPRFQRDKRDGFCCKIKLRKLIKMQCCKITLFTRNCKIIQSFYKEIHYSIIYILGIRRLMNKSNLTAHCVLRKRPYFPFWSNKQLWRCWSSLHFLYKS